jgi:hypothetical protein
MATGEDQPEPVVFHELSLVLVLRVGFTPKLKVRTELVMELTTSGRATNTINRAIPRSSDDPPSRVRWNSILWPFLAGNEERILNGVLGGFVIAEDANECCNSLSVDITKHSFHIGVLPTVIDSPCHAFIRLANRGMDELRWDGLPRPRLCQPKQSPHRDHQR